MIISGLLKDNQARDRAIGDLTGLVQRSLDRPVTQCPRPETTPPHPIIQPDLIDNEGNLHAEDIEITWEGSDTFLHGVRVVGSDPANMPARQRPSTSTPYQPVREHSACTTGVFGSPRYCVTPTGRNARAINRLHLYNASITSR